MNQESKCLKNLGKMPQLLAGQWWPHDPQACALKYSVEQRMTWWPLGQAESLQFTCKQNPVMSPISHHSTALQRLLSFFYSLAYQITFLLVVLPSLQSILKSRQNGKEGGGSEDIEFLLLPIHSSIIYCYWHQLPPSSNFWRFPHPHIQEGKIPG